MSKNLLFLNCSQREHKISQNSRVYKILHGFPWGVFLFLSPSFCSPGHPWLKEMTHNFPLYFPVSVVTLNLTSDFYSHNTREMANFWPMLSVSTLRQNTVKKSSENHLVFSFFIFWLLLVSSQCLHKVVCYSLSRVYSCNLHQAVLIWITSPLLKVEIFVIVGKYHFVSVTCYCIEHSFVILQLSSAHHTLLKWVGIESLS